MPSRMRRSRAATTSSRSSATFRPKRPSHGWSGRPHKRSTRIRVLRPRTARSPVKLHRDWDWAGAEQHFRRALELNPSNADIHHDYAHLLLVMRRDRESVAETERAVALDPFNPMLNACLGWHRLFTGDYDHAIEAA